MRFADDNFTQSFIATIGIDFKIRTIELDGQRIKLQIWDTAGQERFKTITTAYYRGAMGILLVYDVTNEASFKSIANWMRAIEQHASESVNKLLIGNKADSSGPLVGERMVSTEMGEQLAAQHSMKFFETSAKVSKRDPPTHIHIWTMALGKGGPVEGRAPLSSNVPRERCLPSSDPPSSASSARPPSSGPPPPPSLLPLLLTLCLPGSFVTPSHTPTPPPPLPQNDINVEAAFYTIARDVKQRLNATLQATGPLPTQTVRIGFDGSSGGAKKAGVAGCC